MSVDDTLPEAPASDWPLHGGGWSEQRFSPLDQINSQTVDELGLAWEFSDIVYRGRTHRGMEASPIVADGVMYLTGPWSVVYALNAQTGQQLWSYDPEVEGAWARKACCDAVNRGVALHEGTIFVATLDGYLDALDANTGNRVWRTDTLADRSLSYTITGAPRIAGDLIVIGNGGAELGVRGYVSAYEASSGELAWRFYTVPGAGPDEHPEVATARATWGSEARWDIGGGGTVWDSMTYDPELGLLYVGVGNGGPWPQAKRDPGGGDNLYLSSILALNASDGRLVWHYQTTPGDNWDYTATQNIILADIEGAGYTRKVLMQAPKNGFYYVLDRETGELLSAKPYTHVTWADGVDMSTGKPNLRASADYAQEARIVWPGTPGGHNWQPMAYSPETGLAYIPVLEMPQKFALSAASERLTNTLNVQADVRAPPFPEDDPAIVPDDPAPSMRSVLRAWDPVRGIEAWTSDSMTWWNGGVLATAGGIVLQGGSDGVLRIFDAASGDVLRSIKTGTGIMAPPVTYEIDDEQFIAVLAGYGGAQNARLFPGMAALSYQNAERVLVYKLGGRETPLPPPRVSLPPQPIPDDVSTDPEVIAHGLSLFRSYCGRCHAPMGRPNGYSDLWNMPPAAHANFGAIVLDGAYDFAGMAGFGDVMSTEDAEAVRAFIVSGQRTLTRQGASR